MLLFILRVFFDNLGIMNSEEKYQILLFYKYVLIKEPEKVRDWMFEIATDLNLKGRFIIAREGINITLEGTISNTEIFIQKLQSDERFQNIHFKKSEGSGAAFPRLSVKVRPEIVSLKLGVCDIDPNQTTGQYLKPEELHNWIKESKEFFIVDMRNVYEHSVGRFKDSICPPMNNFRDLPKVVKKIKHLKNKTVVTVCTGGIRCEKASGYLISQGFKDVYQLSGGIVSYMEKYPNEDFEGKLYVFDGRVAMGFYTDDSKHKVIGRCEACGIASENFVNCRLGCKKKFILCLDCQADQLQHSPETYCPNGCQNKKNYISFSRLFNQIKVALK